MKKEVFRLEKNGVGPYCYENFYTDIDFPDLEIIENLRAHHNSSTMHPGGQDFDFIIDRKLFGCMSVDQLREWFGPHLQPLQYIGFQIFVYLVPDHQIKTSYSGKQIIFVETQEKYLYDEKEDAARLPRAGYNECCY